MRLKKPAHYLTFTSHCLINLCWSWRDLRCVWLQIQIKLFILFYFFPVLKQLVPCLHLTRLSPNNNSPTVIRCDMFIGEHCFEDLMRYAVFIIYGRILNTQKLTSFQPLWSEVKARAACCFVAICVRMHVGFPATSLWFVCTAAIRRRPATLGHIKPPLLSLICHLD